ncbi:MAG: hypothetical protein AAB518_02280 [Patescibacteria group bacterium]
MLKTCICFFFGSLFFATGFAAAGSLVTAAVGLPGCGLFAGRCPVEFNYGLTMALAMSVIGGFIFYYPFEKGWVRRSRE